MNIYIDHTEITNLERKAGKYNGAISFTKEVTSAIFDRVPDAKVIRSGSITDVDLSDCDVLFLPVAYAYNLSKTVRIRKKYKDIRIYAVVHDRQHNIRRFDPMDRYFGDGIYRLLPVSYAMHLVKSAAYNLLYPRFVRSVDKVFTVSNYSVQALGNKNLKRITYFYQPVSVVDNDAPDKMRGNVPAGEYILFVSGGRREKNLTRALLAFRDFYERTHTDCKLCITGIDRDRLYYIAGRLKLSRAFIDSCIKYYDYVETEELAYLYRNCRYLLYVSKGEGFGLPVLEAIRYGKTALCSWQTSVPEVAGSIMYYVNAYDTASILKGMLYLYDDGNLRYREELVEKKKKIIKEQIELDKYVLVNEILEETDER